MHIFNRIITFLKITWDTINSFLLIKRTYSSCVHFSRQNSLKKCTQTWVIWVNSNLIEIKSLLSEVSVYWTYNLICAFHNNAHNDQKYTGIEPTLLFSAKGLKQSAWTIRPRRYTYNWKKKWKIYAQTM